MPDWLPPSSRRGRLGPEADESTGLIRALNRRLGDDTSPEGLTRVLQDACSSRAGPLGHGSNDAWGRQISSPFERADEQGEDDV